MLTCTRSRDPVDIAIIIPSFNEAPRIVDTLARLREYLLNSGIAGEIIVVNDPGTDNTAELVMSFAENHEDIGVHLVETGIRLGKGGSIRVGVERAQAEIVLFMDADLPTEPSTITRFYQLAKKEADCVFGTRLGAQFSRTEPLIRRILSNGFHLLVLALFGLNYDTQCGVKCFRRKVALELFEHVTVERLAYDVDLVVLAYKHGYTIRELAIPWYFRKWSTVRIGSSILRMFLDLLTIWLKNHVLEPSAMEDEASIARFYDNVRGDVRLRAAESVFLPRRIWYARKDGRILREITSRAKGNPHRRVLDVGFGSGNVLLRLDRTRSLELYGVELSKASVSLLRHLSESIFVIRSDARTLPFASNEFDMIVCSEVIEHLKQSQGALLEFLRVLRQDGFVVITTPNPSLLWHSVEALWTHLRREQLEVHHTAIARNRLVYLLKHAGFGIQEITSLNLGLLTLVVATKTIPEPQKPSH
jgi:dolichyl-phosphate beta-glucosyltransferase